MKKGYQLQMFRAMQLAIKGALKSDNYNCLVLEGIDKICIGMDTYINEIPLDEDCVIIEVYCNVSKIELKNLSYEIIDEINNTMMVKALEIANKEVMVSAAQF